MDILTAVYVILLGANTGTTVYDNIGASQLSEELIMRKWIHQRNAKQIAKCLTAYFDPQYHSYYIKIANLLPQYCACTNFTTRLMKDKFKDGITKAIRTIDNAIYYSASAPSSISRHHSKIALTNLKDELLVETDYSQYFSSENIPKNFKLNKFIDLENIGLFSPERCLKTEVLNALGQLPQHIFPNDIYSAFEKAWIYHHSQVVQHHSIIVQAVKTRFELQLDAKSAEDSLNKTIIANVNEEELEKNSELLKSSEQQLLHHLSRATGLVRDPSCTLFDITRDNKDNDEIIQNEILQNGIEKTPNLFTNEKTIKKIVNMFKKEIKQPATLLTNILRLTALNGFIEIHQRKTEELKNKIETYMSLAHVDKDIDSLLFRANELWSNIKPRGFRMAYLKGIRKLRDSLPKANVHRGIMEFETPSVLVEKVLHKNLDVAIKEQKQTVKQSSEAAGKRVKQRIDGLSSLLEKNTILDKNKTPEEGIQQQIQNFKEMMQNIDRLQPKNANSNLIAEAIKLQEQLLTGEIVPEKYTEEVSQLFLQFQSNIRQSNNGNPSQDKKENTS